MGQNAVRVQQDQQHQRRPLYVVSPRDALAAAADVVVGGRRLPRAAPDHGPRGERKTPTILRHQNNLS